MHWRKDSIKIMPKKRALLFRMTAACDKVILGPQQDEYTI